jgi:D-alanyl-D-alanine carboxypeptidase/D-alanyl-D-alanine-endopeptidase (penicillin-binding protein 4)
MGEAAVPLPGGTPTVPAPVRPPPGVPMPNRPSASGQRLAFPASLRLPVALAAVLLPLAGIAADPGPSAPPAPVAVVAPSASLEEALAPLADDRLFRSAKVGVQVVDVRTGEEVFARSPDTSFVPASTMKVLTAATALKKLGPAYRFTTDFYTDASVEIDGEGTLDGNLYVQGHGDPTLVVEKLWKMVYDLKLEGLTKIDGDIVYDESFLDVDYMLPGWDKEEDLENGPSYYPSLGALSVNYNTVALVVGPGAGVGKPARVLLETPAASYVEIDNQVVTVAEGGRRSVRLEREIVDDPKDPKDPTKRHVKFVLTGTLPEDAGTDKYYRSIVDPTAHFMAAFQEMLALHGIQVTGKHRRGVVPTSPELLFEARSDSLASILADMNKSSNNFMAEQVLRTLGAEVYGLPGTTEKGLRVVSDYLTSLGVDPSEYRLVNGSGLSRDILVRPTHLTAVLVDMAHDDRVGHEFSASLAIAGRDGTLWRRLAEDPGRLRGKTGTIDGVHCLVGYVEAGDGEVYAFSFFVNDIRGDSSQAKRLHDRFARRMFTVGANGPEVVEGGEETPEE